MSECLFVMMLKILVKQLTNRLLEQYFQNRLLTTAMKMNLKKLTEVLFFRLSIFRDSLIREQIRQSSV